MLPTNNKKIVFISRQTNNINIDFRMIRDALYEKDQSLKLIFICKRIEKGFLNKLAYSILILKQMYHLATSKMVIIDSYCIPVCILKHKKSLTVLQIWHSIGKIKKSGYQTLDTTSGRSSKMAKIMCMHKNYTNIVTGGRAFDKFYEEGFNVKKDILLHYGLPRIDYLIENETRIKQEIYQKYPELQNKKIVYYTPTFRTYQIDAVQKMLDQYNNNDFALIIRSHPNQSLAFDEHKVYQCLDFKSTEILTVADYVITDYSSICLEAAILNKKVLFYLYDYDTYIKENGLNLDASKLLPTCSSKDNKELFNIIKHDSYDDYSYQQFRKKYLPTDLDHSTEKIVNYIIQKIENNKGEVR